MDLRRREARLLGLVRYQGRACPHGHDGERYVLTCECIGCHRLKVERARLLARRRRLVLAGLDPELPGVEGKRLGGVAGMARLRVKWDGVILEAIEGLRGCGVTREGVALRAGVPLWFVRARWKVLNPDG